MWVLRRKRRGETVDKIRCLKIALLIVILAEEVRNAIKPAYSIKMNVDNEQLKTIVDNYFFNDNSNLN
ncbi:hypothetical protein BUZ57_06740 [Staphylococcus hyicus]|uniref:Uncharacterized protein n=1 Tax=Staphylococcus hyicus TaxID=1284 RepID=A0A418JIU9_STAHY|nr:hypothetical protein BUZ57_06740 [Staphylococcus hyicus]